MAAPDDFVAGGKLSTGLDMGLHPKWSYPRYPKIPLAFGLPILLFFSVIASADSQYVITPDGSDRVDCLTRPCATIQHVIDLCPTRCSIVLLKGSYRQTTNVFYCKAVTISGPADGAGKCI
jgi:hypothetical protein